MYIRMYKCSSVESRALGEYTCTKAFSVPHLFFHTQSHMHVHVHVFIIFMEIHGLAC